MSFLYSRPIFHRTCCTFIFLVFTIFGSVASPPLKLHIAHHPNGKVSERGHYDGELRQGVWVFYNEQGLMEKKEKWKRGQLWWQVFYTKGKVTKVIDRNGKEKLRPACGC